MVRATAIASLALVISLVTSAVLLSQAYLARGEQPYRHARTLDVTGSAKARIRSDLALWTIRVRGEAPTLEDAYARLDAAVEAVRGFLAPRGFPDAAAGPINTETHYRPGPKGQPTREVAAYALTREFRVASPDVAGVGKAAGEVTQLLRTGAHVVSIAPEFVYTKLADLKIRMVREATENGRERAETIAEGSGCRIGAVKEARAGVLQITPPWSTEASSEGIHDTSTVEKDVTAVVRLTFMIER
ncbi:MAG: SIMPL domain-containing protein [Planctomycetales bacterium]|nr:SIMPL domain-containing protein [Planctomycetales bacterium]